MQRFSTRLVVSLFLSLIAGGATLAANPVQQHNSNAVWFENWTGLSNATLTISAPNGKVTDIHASSGTPVFQLSGSEVLDGIYTYELRAATDERVAIVNPQNDGRGDAQTDTEAKPFYMSGSFTVSRGVIITPEEVTESDSN